MKRLVTLIALTAFVAVVALAQQGAVITDTIYSQILDAPRAYTIYLPPSHKTNPDKKYPVLYLLHGLWGQNTDWSKNTQLRTIADRMIGSGEITEMIIVTPDADEGCGKDMQCGYFNVPGWAYEDFFFNEFIPQIEARYRGIGDKQHRAVAGLSMGGGGTAGYAQHHPEMFAAAYPMSALMSAQENRWSSRPGDKYSVLNQSVMDNDHIKFVINADDATKQALRTVAWYVDCGDDDFLLDFNIDFYRAMRQAGIPCQFSVRDGAHNWEYWNTALYTCLPFVSRAFGR